MTVVPAGTLAKANLYKLCMNLKNISLSWKQFFANQLSAAGEPQSQSFKEDGSDSNRLATRAKFP